MTKTSKLEIDTSTAQKNLDDLSSRLSTISGKAGELESAFEQAGEGMSAFADGMKYVKGGMDLLAKHPIIAAFILLIGLIIKIVDAFKKNEQALNKLKQAFAPLQGIMNVCSQIFDKFIGLLADGLVKTLELVTKGVEKTLKWLSKLAENFGLDSLAAGINKVNNAISVNSELVSKDIELTEKRRKYKVEEAKIEGELIDLQRKLNEAEGNIIKQKQIAAKIDEKRQEQAKKEVELAQLEFDILKKRASISAASAEEKDQLAEAEANLIRAQNKLREVTADTTQVIEKQTNEVKNLNSETEKAEDPQKRLSELIKGINDELTTSTKKLQIETNKRIATIKEENNAETERVSILAVQRKQLQDGLYQNEKTIEKLADLRSQAVQQGLDVSEIDNEITDLTLQNSQTRIQILENEQQAKEAIDAQLFVDEETKLEKYDELTQRYIQLGEVATTAAEAIISAGEGINEKWGEVIASMTSGIELVRETLKDGEMSFEDWGRIASLSCKTVGVVFSALADDQDKKTKSGFQKQKKLQIASATMQMLAGLVGAWTSAMALPYPASIIAGASTSAMIGAMGAVQISKIKKQKFDGGDDGGGASTSSASASASTTALTNLQSPVQYSAEVQGASVEQQTKENRVYVVESDITNVQNRVQTVEAESTF